MEHVLTRPAGLLALPAGRPRCAVLVLSGSSGRIETGRVRLLARHGAAALSVRWFGDTGQPPGICEVALETFTPALDRLARLSGHLAVIGASKGAEAALLLAARDQRVRAVAALSPTSLVWANVGAGADGEQTPQRSSWTEHGRPLPFVPYDDTWHADRARRADAAEPPAFRGLYEQSLRTFADRVPAARIPVERIEADVLLSAGGDDQVWPSEYFTHEIARTRAEHDLPTITISEPAAGHRVHLPAEPAAAGGQNMQRGGTDQADAALGQRVWTALRDLLHLVG